MHGLDESRNLLGTSPKSLRHLSPEFGALQLREDVGSNHQVGSGVLDRDGVRAGVRVGIRVRVAMVTI